MAGRFRGRGRGGGRDGRGLIPTAVDEDGKLLTDLIEGPPPDYPEMKNMPKVPPITDKEHRLLDRWHRLRHSFRSGPFSIEPKKTTGDVDVFEVERYSDRFKKRKAMDKPPLTAVVTLSPYYFPEELSSMKDRRAAKRFAASSKSLEAFWSNQAKTETEFDKFEEMAKEEEEEEDGAKKRGGPDEMNEQDQDEDEDECFGSEDDWQGNAFDDDDGYDDDFDDGGGDEPFY